MHSFETLLETYHASLLGKKKDMVWAFQPALPVEKLAAEDSVFAERVYLRVKKDMQPGINGAVMQGFDTFRKAMPGDITGALLDELEHGWMLKHYVKCVDEVVTRAEHAQFIFQPAVTLEMLPAADRVAAAELYQRVDVSIAEHIASRVTQGLDKCMSLLPQTASEQLKMQ